MESKNKSTRNKSSSKLWILIGVIVIGLAIFAANSPLFKLNLNSTMNPNYIEFPEVTPFEGNLKPNTFLQNAKYIGRGKLRGPETIVFDKDGNLYTGTVNGQIVKIDKNDRNKIVKVVQMGEENDEKICNDPHGSPKCGRPLGMKLIKDKDLLYVADSYYGIFKIDLLTGTKTLIISSKDTRFGASKLKFVNDLDLDGEVIYFIDTSNERDVSEALQEHAEAQPRGRLFKFDQSTGQVELLLDNLYFPNGMTLTPEKDALLVNENTAARILKIYVKGEKKGTVETFANLPGFSDNIRLTERQTLLVPFAITRNNYFGSLLDRTGRFPFIRKFLSYFIDFSKVLGYIPKYGLLIEYDLKGNVLKSWHDPNGSSVESASHIEIFENKMYLGSFYIDYIAVVDY